jgi:cold shock protein
VEELQMSKMPSKTDVLAETIVCERILALDESRLNLALSKALDPDQFAQFLHDDLGCAARDPASPVAAEAAPWAVVGTMKFFDARRGLGFLVVDGIGRDALVLAFQLRNAGFPTAYEGARVHALVQEASKGLQVVRILSMDESTAVHPSQLPQRTREKVVAESSWVRAIVKWYDYKKGYGFVCEGENRPDCLVHADTLRRWGVAPLWPKQVVEVRWGNTPKGRMAAEIRYPGDQVRVPPAP